MTGEYRTGARILAALADAPMNREALMHELDLSAPALNVSLAHLVKAGKVEQDDRGCWHLIKPDAVPPPVVSRGEPPVAPTAEERAIADVVQQLTSARPTTSISVGDQVLQVLIAAGRITAEDVRMASQLIASRA